MNASQRAPKPITLAPETERLRAFDVREIMQDETQVRMVLDGQAYFLRITRAGKLILTK
jgi:hemin uptake protein HemP